MLSYKCRQTSTATHRETEYSDSLLQKRNVQFNETVYPALIATVETGYLITRMGRDITSQLLAGFNKNDTSFSHCGIVIIENDTPFVYHCIGGEFNPDQKMKREKLIDFGAPLDARRIGVFKPAINSSENERLVTIIKGWHNAGLPFDMEFSLDTDDKMYCTEMVAKAFEKATQTRCRIESRNIENFNFIPVENTYTTHWMKEKLKLDY